MADRPAPTGNAHAAWSDAFVTLPLEAAPQDGWARLQSALDARPAIAVKRPRRTWHVALAATLAALALAPFVHRSASPDASLPTQPVAVRPHAEAAEVEAARVDVAAPTTALTDDTVAAGTAVTHVPDSTRAARQGRHAPKARHVRAPRVAHAEPAAAAPEQDETRALSTLYAESAQLESLLQLTRNDTLASATDAVLSGEAYERVALVDAALSQDGLDASQRAQLWRERVVALREAVGVASTSRWLATRGEHLEDALVRVD